MKKVCHLTSAHTPSDIRIFYKECQTLVATGYDVMLIVQHNRDEVIDGVKILGVAKPRNRRERMLQTARQVYKKALECDADIYHFHDPELIPVGLKLKRMGKKVIYDVHEDVPRQILSKQWIPAPLRKTISWTVERIENYAAKRFDFIVTATPFIRDRFLEINKNVIDVNNYPHSSMIISGQMTRDEALGKLAEPLYEEQQLQKDLAFILGELSISRKEFDKLMSESPRQHTDYRTSILNRAAQVFLKLRQKTAGY